jgi:hypothetical protein
MMEVMASQMSAILLGHSGENAAVRVAFDLTAFQKAFPGGQPLLLVRRYADTTAYPAPLTVEEQTAYWTVGAADTARAGYGQCELQWYLEDGTLAKSDLFDFLVLGTLKTDAAPPDAPSRRWFEAIRRQLGDLSKLTTQAKENLVAAINEAAKTGSGSVGSAALRVSEGYIQFRNGDEWENLIAKSELEGTKGAPGEDGETPTIGENGNWYIGPEDTGKPSRGAPGAAASDAQVSSAVDTWLTEHPEATTTVQDGSVSVEKLGYGKHIYGSKPYFCNSVGSGAASFGSIGVVVPCKAGDTIYCTFNMSTSGAYQKPQLLAALPENQYGAIAPIGTIEKDDTTKAYTVPESATTAKAMYLPQNFVGIPAANNGSVEDALAWINNTMGTDGKWCAQNVPFTELDAWYQTAQAELFDIDERCNKLMYASLYQAVSKLVGAKVAVLGDSLTEQSACSFITSAYNDRWMENVLRDTARTGDDGKTYKGSGWFALIARKYKIKWWCAGHGAQWWYSTTERPNGATAMVRKLIDGTDEFDYIVLEYGTNDILSGYTHIGTAADEASETATTSCGAIKWCIEQLQTRFPEASIVVILPNIRSGANGEAPATQEAYLDAVVPILKKYSVRYVNMAEDSGIVKSMMFTDGVHLRWPVVSNNVTYYTNDTPAVRKFSKCLEAELLKA